MEESRKITMIRGIMEESRKITMIRGIMEESKITMIRGILEESCRKLTMISRIMKKVGRLQW